MVTAVTCKEFIIEFLISVCLFFLLVNKTVVIKLFCDDKFPRTHIHTPARAHTHRHTPTRTHVCKESRVLK